MNTEPLSVIEAWRLVLVALLGAVPLFTPVALTEAQSAGVLVVFGAVSALLTAYGRGKVVPVPVANEVVSIRAHDPNRRTASRAITAGEYRRAHAAVRTAA